MQSKIDIIYLSKLVMVAGCSSGSHIQRFDSGQRDTRLSQYYLKIGISTATPTHRGDLLIYSPIVQARLSGKKQTCEVLQQPNSPQQVPRQEANL